MSFNREEIQIKQFTSGTTLMYFSTHLDVYAERIPNASTNTLVSPTIIEFNSLNQPVRVSTFDGQHLWTLNDDNNYVPVTSYTNNFLTGYSYVEDYSYIITQNRVQQISTALTQAITGMLAQGNQDSSAELDSNGSAVLPVNQVPIESSVPHYEYVFANYHEIDDFFVDVKLNRTYGTLDTLNIYDNLINSIPTQESETGVVFGRLTALQNIKDIEGNSIRIPLRNVPIGIFNPSEDYPTSSSVSENGDRLFLNLKENSDPTEYFNIESFSADTNQYLRSASQFTVVPDQYKYVTTTNENGEFIIYDAPVGTQIVVFEVDLFKQGLTKDEIALNFFPFPPGDGNDVVIDSIPCYSFKQFPIDVVPAWGTTQTGYTELNITVNYDLRKWATYYVAPMAYDGNLLGSAELLNFAPSLNLQVRDMSKEGFPTKNIPIVEIQDIYDKDEDQTLLWNSEFVQLKNTVSFFDHGFKAFKLRANMYDPNGYRTDKDGIPINYPSQKGVWLAGYQLKMYYNQPSTIFRTTGFQRDWGFSNPGWRGRDHFHLNRNLLSPDPNTSTLPNFAAPYDRPWDHNYPEPYKIPSRPTQLNFVRNNYATRLTNGSGAAYLEQPLYKDGDLVGFPVNNTSVSNDPNTGGYGKQYSSSNVFWPSNRFSKEVTRRYIYKYEGGVAWNEKYSNGYEPSNPSFPVDPGASFVVNGEKYQRVECGYGYWLRPEGWPPISFEPWGDTIFSQSTRPGAGLSSSFGPGVLAVGQSNGNVVSTAQIIPIDVYNVEDRDLALALDNNANYSEGALDLYRVVDPNDRNPVGPQVVPTSAIFRFQSFYFQRGPNGSQRIKTAINNDSGNGQDEYFSKVVGGSPHASFGYFGSTGADGLLFEIINNGNIEVDIPGTSITLAPGQSYTFTMAELPLDGTSIELPGNSNFDFGSSKYTTANYTMRFRNIRCRRNDGSPLAGSSSHNVPYDYTISNTAVPADSTPPDYWLITRYGNVKTQYNGSCKTSGSFPNGNGYNQNSVKMNGALFNVPGTSGGGYIIDIRFWDEPISATCGEYNFNNNSNQVFSIPIEVTS